MFFVLPAFLVLQRLSVRFVSFSFSFSFSISFYFSCLFLLLLLLLLLLLNLLPLFSFLIYLSVPPSLNYVLHHQAFHGEHDVNLAGSVRGYF